jgi:hypothetical protein
MSITILLETNILSFYRDMSELFPNEKSFVYSHMLVGTKVPMESIIYFIINMDKRDIQCIKEMSDSYFLSVNPLLKFINVDSAIYFSRIWSILDKTEKDIIWSYFASFILLANKCV